MNGPLLMPLIDAVAADVKDVYPASVVRKYRLPRSVSGLSARQGVGAFWVLPGSSVDDANAVDFLPADGVVDGPMCDVRVNIRYYEERTPNVETHDLIEAGSAGVLAVVEGLLLARFLTRQGGYDGVTIGAFTSASHTFQMFPVGAGVHSDGVFDVGHLTLLAQQFLTIPT